MTYRAAIVGAGAPTAQTNANLEGFSIGYSHAEGYLAHPGVDVVAIADINAANAQELAKYVGGAASYPSLGALLAEEQIDILSVCTWPTLHHEMVLEAIAAGVKMILCEKPMAVGMQEIDAMVEAANAAGVRLFVNHQRRYEQPYAGVRRLIQDGHLGDVLRIEGYVGDGWDLMSWGSHWVDMARYFASDATAEWVLAATDTTGNVRYGHDVEDQMLLQFGFADGPIAVVHTGPRTTGAGLFVTGSKGAVSVASGKATIMTASDGAQALHHEYLSMPEQATDGFTAAIADAIASTENGVPSLIDGASGQAATEIIMAAYASAQAGQALQLPLQDRSIDIRSTK